jgi:hypothetical protein
LREDSSSLSLWSEDSFLSVASKGSALSIGSVGSFGSIGSIGCAGCAFSTASVGSIGSAFSAGSAFSVMSYRASNAVMGEPGRSEAMLIAAGTLCATAAALAWCALRNR